MIVSEPCTSFLMTRPVIGFALMLHLGFSGSGAALSHGGKSFILHALARLVGGFGQTLSQHAGFCGSGGSGHLPLHAGQFGGGDVDGHTVRHAGFFGSNENSSQVASTSGIAASFGGSGISTFVRSIAIGPV